MRTSVGGLSRYVLVALAWWASLLAAAARADMIELQPSKDNTLIQRTDPASQLSNGQGDIFVGRTNQDGQDAPTISIRRGLIQFDIAGSLPADAIITSVTLTMRDVQGLNGDRDTTLHVVLQDWGEGTSFFNGGQGAAATNNDATWLYTFYNAANPAASPTWSTPGGNFDAAASASSIVSDDLGGGQLFTWSSADMVADVQYWLAHPESNFGWLMQGVESAGQTAKRFNSGESTIAPNQPPRLTIEFVPEPATLALCGTAALALVGMRMIRRRQDGRCHAQVS